MGFEIQRLKSLYKKERDCLTKIINSKDIFYLLEGDSYEYFDDKYFSIEVSSGKSKPINYLNHKNEEAIINLVELFIDDTEDEENFDVNKFVLTEDTKELCHIASLFSSKPKTKK